jgi:DNA-binding IclR family transcriptional regulator
MDRTPSVETISPEASGSTSNRSVERAAQILASFRLDTPWLSLAELARRAGLPKATTHRLVAALKASGLLTQGSDGRYGLGVRLLELGAVVRENLDAIQLCRPAIDAVAAATGETVLLSTVDWSARETMLVARRDSPHPLAVLPPVGLRQSMPPGGVQVRALLAGLPPDEVEQVVNAIALVPRTPNTTIEQRLLLRLVALARERGFASEQDEYIDGVSGVAVPVLFDGDRPLAAVGVVGPTSRLAGQIEPLGAHLLRETAALRPDRIADSVISGASYRTPIGDRSA